MLTFVGLGLDHEGGLTLSGLKRAVEAEKIYIELYTSLMPRLSIQNLEKILGKPIVKLSREDLEERPEETILKDADASDVVLLVPGDPMAATTHIDLRLRAYKLGIETKVIPGVSILTAAAGAAGLQNYKFGRTVTIPFPSEIYRPETPYDVIGENTARRLHTLVLLDIAASHGRYMTVREGLEYLLSIEKRRREGVVTPERIAVGVARVGSDQPTIKCSRVGDLLQFDFGGPPHIIIFIGELHFMEKEALKAFAGAHCSEGLLGGNYG
ncbi:MAG: diphthine synthase [Candidatus Bathyarchaeia archaeon]